jgi:hypothetical protein
MMSLNKAISSLVAMVPLTGLAARRTCNNTTPPQAVLSLHRVQALKSKRVEEMPDSCEANERKLQVTHLPIQRPNKFELCCQRCGRAVARLIAATCGENDPRITL